MHPLIMLLMQMQPAADFIEVQQFVVPARQMVQDLLPEYLVLDRLKLVPPSLRKVRKRSFSAIAASFHLLSNEPLYALAEPVHSSVLAR